MIIDMVTEADMVLFNRCKEDMPLSGWKRSIRAVNRMCQMAFEDENGDELEVRIPCVPPEFQGHVHCI